MVELREITPANLEDVLNLQVFEYQDKFVSSVAYALAQAYVYYETAFPFAIYVGDTLVGFIMLGFYTNNRLNCGYNPQFKHFGVAEVTPLGVRLCCTILITAGARSCALPPTGKAFKKRVIRFLNGY